MFNFHLIKLRISAWSHVYQPFVGFKFNGMVNILLRQQILWFLKHEVKFVRHLLQGTVYLCIFSGSKFMNSRITLYRIHPSQHLFIQQFVIVTLLKGVGFNIWSLMMRVSFPSSIKDITSHTSQFNRCLPPIMTLKHSTGFNSGLNFLATLSLIKL